MDRIDDLLWTHRGLSTDLQLALDIWMDTQTLIMSSGPAGHRKYRLREPGEMGERIREYNRVRD